MEKFDHLYVSITQEVGGIEGLFTSLFSFLLRRTDFFYEADPGDKMGFPPGVNEKMLLNIFNQFRSLHYKNNPKKSVDEYAKKYVKYAKANNLPLPGAPAKPDTKQAPKPAPSPPEKPPASKPQSKPSPESAPVPKPPIDSKPAEGDPKEPESKAQPSQSLFTDIR